MTSDEPTAVNIDMLAATLRADAGDLGTFVEALAVKLEEAVPGRVSAERRRDGMFGPKRVRRIALDAGGRRLELRADGGAVQARVSRVSGGIVIKSEELGIDEWLQVLGEVLAAEAESSTTTRQALQRLLEN